MLRYLITTIIASTALLTQAQTARSLFDSIPQTMLPLLTQVNRADFIDFKESNMQAKVKNRLGETSEMTDFTENYIRIELTEKSTWEMKLFADKDSATLICVVHTVCGAVCDSHVKLYTASWKELPTENYLVLPQISDFPITKESEPIDSTLYKNFLQLCDMRLMQVTLAKEEPTLSISLTTPQYFSKDDLIKMQPLSLLPVNYTWKFDESAGNYRFVKE